MNVARELLTNAEPQAPPGPSGIKIYILTSSPGDPNAGGRKAKFFSFVEIYSSVTAAYFLCEEPHGR